MMINDMRGIKDNPWGYHKTTTIMDPSIYKALQGAETVGPYEFT